MHLCVLGPVAHIPQRWVFCKCFLMMVVLMMYEGLFILAERVDILTRGTTWHFKEAGVVGNVSTLHRRALHNC